jgi:hypothetical protein
MRQLAEFNGEQFGIEMSESLRAGYGHLFVADELSSAVILEPYTVRGGAADDLLRNKCL